MVRIHSNLGSELVRLKRIQARCAYQARARLGDIPWMETVQGALAAAMIGEETVWMASILRGLSPGKTGRDKTLACGIQSGTRTISGRVFVSSPRPQVPKRG